MNSKYIKIDNRIDLNRIIVYIVFFLLGLNYFLYAFLGIQEYKTAIRICSIAMILFLYFVRSQFYMKDIVMLMISTYMIIINGSITLNLAFQIILAISMMWIDEGKLNKWMVIVNSIFIILVFVFLITGIEQNIKLVYVNRIRNTLGFEHVNFAGLLMFSTFSIYLLSLKRIKWIHLLFVLFSSIVIYMYTDSRAGFIGIVVFVATYVLMNKINVKIGEFISIIIILCFFVSPIIWQIPFMNSYKMNLILSRRPFVYINYINSHTIVNFLFGGSKISEIDNFYLMLLYNVGIVIYILIMVLTICLIKKLYRSKDITKISFVISVLTIGLVESGVIRPELICMPIFWKHILEVNVKNNLSSNMNVNENEQ